MTTTIHLNGKPYECELDWWFDLGDICFQLIEARDEDGEKVDAEVAGRLGLARSFLAQLPEIRKRVEAGEPCGAEANMAKRLAADASNEAANVAIQTHGGFGFACEYDVERKFRETRLYQVAPISTNLILSHVAEHVLGLPRSF